MPAKIDITGNKYGKLTAICERKEFSGKHTKWLFMCECGEEYIARKSHVVNGEMDCCRSCQKALARVKSTTHGLTYDSEGNYCKTFQAWMNIKKRCYDQSNSSYGDYGGIGITMQQSWVEDPSAFVTYMGQAPSKSHSVERLDRFKGYEEGNIIWALPVTQSRNRKSSRSVPSCVYLMDSYYMFRKKVFGKSHTVRFYFNDEDSKDLAELAVIEYRSLVFSKLNKVLPDEEKYSNTHGLPSSWVELVK